MAITRLGLRTSRRTEGKNAKGQKVFLVGSDTKISDDISSIMDATYGGNSVPDYNDVWGSDATDLFVTDKIAEAIDVEGATQEGLWWHVTVDYSVPESVQQALDPRDRDWEWSKSGDKRETVIAASTFDTSGYVFPTSSASNMINLGEGDAFTNTAGEPPEGGVPRVSSRTTINLTKYIDNPTDVGAASWEDLDNFKDKVNSDEVIILGVTYNEKELLMDEVNYGSVTENGYEVIRLTFSLIADKEFKHIFSYVSAGYNQVVNDDLKPIRDADGETVSSPQLLDETGVPVPLPGSSPYIKTPYILSGGTNTLKAFSGLTLPSTIP